MAHVDFNSFMTGTTRGHKPAQDMGDGLLLRLYRSIFDMSGQTRRILAQTPSEARLLMFVLLSNMIFALSWSLKTLVSPAAAEAGQLGTDVILWLLVAMTLRTALVYALAVAIHGAVRVLGGQGSLQETRTGVFWGVLVAAPFGLAVSQLAVFMHLLQDDVPLLRLEVVQMLPGWLGMVPFVWFVAKGAAVANRMESHIPLVAILSGAGIILALAFRMFAG